MKELDRKIVKRNSYLAKIRPFMGKPLIKVFIGQRRVGKSFLLYQLMAEIGEKDPAAHIIYINKEDFAFDSIRNYQDLIQYVESKLSGNGIQYVFVDEIQDIEGFEKAVRHLVLNPQLDLYITGSNAQLLSGELATLLSGRYMACKVFSLSYTEFLDFMQLEAGEVSLQRYLDWGGLPFLQHLEANTAVVMEYLQAMPVRYC